MQDWIGLTGTQRLLVRDLRQRYAHTLLGIAQDRTRMINEDGPIKDAAIAPLQNSAQAVRKLDRSTKLASCTALQREAFIHLVRVFLFQVLTPFQVYKPKCT